MIFFMFAMSSTKKKIPSELDVRANYLVKSLLLRISVRVGGMSKSLTDLTPTPWSRTFFPPPASLASV